MKPKVDYDWLDWCRIKQGLPYMQRILILWQLNFNEPGFVLYSLRLSILSYIDRSESKIQTFSHLPPWVWRERWRRAECSILHELARPQCLPCLAVAAAAHPVKQWRPWKGVGPTLTGGQRSRSQTAVPALTWAAAERPGWGTGISKQSWATVCQAY